MRLYALLFASSHVSSVFIIGIIPQLSHAFYILLNGKELRKENMACNANLILQMSHDLFTTSRVFREKSFSL